MKVVTRSIFFAVLLVSQSVMAEYLETIPVFWKTLYPNGGVSLYCGKTFIKGDRRYNIEHVFPMSWVTRSLQCGSRRQCRANSALFNQIEADMHNMYPADKALNAERGSMAYGILKGERWIRKDCDLEINQRQRRVEPRPAVRGDIARAMLYLADRYELKLYQRDQLLRWHRQDPPDAAERQRNQRIKSVQGNENHWIVPR